MTPRGEVNNVNKIFSCSDHQSSAANIYINFHENISNGSQEIEEHTYTKTIGSKIPQNNPQERSK